MRHHNTVFHALLKLVPWHVFDRLVDLSKADKKVRRLTTRDQFIALLYAQLAGSESLRAIEAGFASHASKLYHLGACEVSRSTLADANARRPCAVFSGLLSELMSRCERRLGRQMADAVYLIDSTGFRLSSLSAGWAQFCAGVSAAKLHIVYNPDNACPSFAAVTPANVNDITVAKELPIRPGATYVFDLGYYDYSYWAKLDAAGCRIVTRLNRGTGCRAKWRSGMKRETAARRACAQQTAVSVALWRCECDQWKESPQAHDPLAFGLSIVKPCFSIVSTKSIVAPLRYGTLILSVTTCTAPNSLTTSPSISRSSKYSW